MKKYTFLLLSILLTFSQSFGQTFAEKVKKSYKTAFPSEKGNFLIKLNPMSYEDATNSVVFSRQEENDLLFVLRNNLSVGYIFKDKIVVGASSFNSLIDIRLDGTEPIINGQHLFGKTFFLEYHLFSIIKAEIENKNAKSLLDNAYASIHLPFDKGGAEHDISQKDAIKMGFGLRFKLIKSLNLDLSYNRFLNSDINDGFYKGSLQLGVSFIL